MWILASSKSMHHTAGVQGTAVFPLPGVSVLSSPACFDFNWEWEDRGSWARLATAIFSIFYPSINSQSKNNCKLH